MQRGIPGKVALEFTPAGWPGGVGEDQHVSMLPKLQAESQDAWDTDRVERSWEHQQQAW